MLKPLKNIKQFIKDFKLDFSRYDKDYDFDKIDRKLNIIELRELKSEANLILNNKTFKRMCDFFYNYAFAFFINKKNGDIESVRNTISLFNKCFFLELKRLSKLDLEPKIKKEKERNTRAFRT